ncbi:PREDICTED: MORC family CW-type zinc finger protein 2-like [Thamnophis sirtalis]|uniref:MORC family CW-type zinc finger protein 2-like n=1 Tax=Thamnophis sirtalis TaxID=35019 RepID=A0A6I9XU80_9SAUR|nr:PREDICTED: MORC family CW-type zinc finger protein 2-like [Thamnophis sirtalis]
MEPTHNKQAFANIKEYRHLLKSMENYLFQYWKDMGMGQKGQKFWIDFGYLSDKWNERPSETVQYKRRRAAEIPYIVQCDLCLKWRFLSLNTDINNEVNHDIWNCGRSSNSLENKCSIPENLPRIPLGTFNPTHYLNDKEQLLIDSIQRNKRKVEKLQLRLIQPHKLCKHTDDSKTTAKDVSNLDCNSIYNFLGNICHYYQWKSEIGFRTEPNAWFNLVWKCIPMLLKNLTEQLRMKI